MAEYGAFKDIGVEVDDFVATVEIRRPPSNFFDQELIREIADAYEALDDDPACRAIVLASDGKAFCAGAQFGKGSGAARTDSGQLYREAVRLFRAKTPVVAAVQGAAVGGGLGLALSADFRITCPEGRFTANFSRLGFHPGFGLSVTLPELVGRSQAMRLCLTGRRIKGDEAVAIGLADELVPLDALRDTARERAREIAGSAPLAVTSIRATLRHGLADRVEAILEHEAAEQARLMQTDDAREGIRAMAERRTPDFAGR